MRTGGVFLVVVGRVKVAVGCHTCFFYKRFAIGKNIYVEFVAVIMTAFVPTVNHSKKRIVFAPAAAHNCNACFAVKVRFIQIIASAFALCCKPHKLLSPFHILLVVELCKQGGKLFVDTSDISASAVAYRLNNAIWPATVKQGKSKPANLVVKGIAQFKS